MVSKNRQGKPKKPSRPKVNSPKVDSGGSARSFPGPHGPMISKNPDLGSGPYSQNNGKPYGGVPAGEFVEKQRKKTKQKAKDYGKVVSELAKAYLKIATDIALDKLRPNDVITVYHATPDMYMPMLWGVDATQDHHRYYGGPRHAGIFVSPDFETARRFSPNGIVIEFNVKASDLYGTDYSGRTYKELKEVGTNPNDVWRDKFPESFSPYLSTTLTQSPEPQALFKGIIKPNDITRVWYKGKWYTLDEFYSTEIEYYPPNSMGKPTKFHRLSFDPTDGDISLDEMYAIIEKEHDHSKEKTERLFNIYADKNPDRLVELLEQLHWVPTAAKNLAKKVMEARNG